ncbi:flavin reductase family protein [Paenibacillus sp. N3/727]|uniref:flavin reductase family protein n=1 Tax=Paenibacillus sp. N3/727 TaxID=2925845 RepID=UPI001F5300B6|nr:flavin reductase family protein [Paenibacillus sp. N3/727]UNK16257.1 flavin reductase family protein [Paenibacillus sp. N3/727]
MEKSKVDYEKMYYGFPVILISFYDKNGVPNVTTLSSSYSLKDMVVLGFNTKGYAINEIIHVKDFVINVPDRSLVQEINFCGSKSGFECSKFDEANLTPVKSPLVNAPVIQECPIAIECTLTDVIERDQYQGITNVLAAVKGRYVAKEYLDHEGRLQPSMLNNILYVGDGVNRGYRYMEECNN